MVNLYDHLYIYEARLTGNKIEFEETIREDIFFTVIATKRVLTGVTFAKAIRSNAIERSAIIPDVVAHNPFSQH